jgi:hypothetical protein
MTAVADTGTRPDLHHSSHNHLLDDVTPSTPGRLDAIIVPTFREPHALRDALALARDLDRPLLALCSGEAHGRKAIALAADYGVDLRAIDLHEVRPRLPGFRADHVLRAADFAQSGDLSLKRNLGLLIARAEKWERVLFLDDDIHRVRDAELAAAVLDSGEYRAVGLSNVGFADNSVVCHAYREIGNRQDSFIGGGAMIVNPLRTRSFFPNIYNEDWFFLLGDGVPFRAARSGTMIQRTYDPFATTRRAENEELGDTLAEGLFWMLDYGQDPLSCDTAFWGGFLYRRRGLLDMVLGQVGEKVASQPKATAITAALRGARGRSSFITPSLCDAFVRAWGQDLRTWDAFLTHFATIDTVDKALAELGLVQQTSSHVVTAA